MRELLKLTNLDYVFGVSSSDDDLLGRSVAVPVAADAAALQRD